MRILVDESLPLKLAPELIGLDVSTVRKEQWTGLRNGVLLRTAAAAGFDVVLTADHSLPYQQNLRAIGIAVIVITGVRNRIGSVRPLIPQIESALAFIELGEAIVISPRRRDSVYDRPEAFTSPILQEHSL